MMPRLGGCVLAFGCSKPAEALRNAFLAGRVRSRVVFRASAVDCESTVEVTNRLDRGTRFARAIDQVFTADNVGTALSCLGNSPEMSGILRVCTCHARRSHDVCMVIEGAALGPRTG